jgi:hydroxymethylpyrimidine kinase/phosphomethylpyrimidine kinase/thiamine-phosphate diphosphorylase
MSVTNTAPQSAPPIVWSIAGHDSSGGAGLSADQRAADAMGVHLCPVVAALTAQHSQGVEAVVPVAPDTLAAQLQALALDLPPQAIKTGLLGSIDAIEQVARWVDHWRSFTPVGTDPHRQLALVVDPVLGASSGGAAFSNEAIVAAYRRLLLPRATVITPNRAEAHRLLNLPAAGHEGEHHNIPALATQLHALGARSVVITGGDAPDSLEGHCLDWLLTPHAQGWLTAPRVATRHNHGTGCTFASGVAAAWAKGHVEADAIVLANLLTRHALMHAHAAGQGPGPVMARAGFAAGQAHGGAPMPWLGMGEALPWALTTQATQASTEPPRFLAFTPPHDGLYGIVESAARIDLALQAGLLCVQLRHKAAEGIESHLQGSINAAAQAGAQLFINDHWQAALAQPEPEAPQSGYRLGLHLGQEDLLALSPTDQASLLSARSRVMLGLSSHSLWELARALGCGASYIACGPVQATTTKDMPWVPQGTDNLRWWANNSTAPVVAIGGLLSRSDIARHVDAQPAAWCVVRALGPDLPQMEEALLALHQAVQQGRALGLRQAQALPHAVL